MNLTSARSLVNSAFSIAKLRERLLSNVDEFHVEGKVTETIDGVTIYKDNNAKILAVAHLDYVGRSCWARKVRVNGTTAMFSPAVDDRVGAYVILDLLPQILGNQAYDVLLTEGEEIGRSTARHFSSEKSYRWLFSFDRTGTDVVMYDYETDYHVKLLDSVGFEMGIGSFSDIVYLEDLGATGFNFGTGYYNEHTDNAHVIKSHLTEMVSRFLLFYKRYQKISMPYKPSVTYTYYPTKGANISSLGYLHNEIDEYGWSTKPDCPCECGVVIDTKTVYQQSVSCNSCGRSYWWSTKEDKWYASIYNANRCLYCDGRLVWYRNYFKDIWPSSLYRCDYCKAYHVIQYEFGSRKEREITYYNEDNPWAEPEEKGDIQTTLWTDIKSNPENLLHKKAHIVPCDLCDERLNVDEGEALKIKWEGVQAFVCFSCKESVHEHKCEVCEDHDTQTTNGICATCLKRFRNAATWYVDEPKKRKWKKRNKKQVKHKHDPVKEGVVYDPHEDLKNAGKVTVVDCHGLQSCDMCYTATTEPTTYYLVDGYLICEDCATELLEIYKRR